MNGTAPSSIGAAERVVRRIAGHAVLAVADLDRRAELARARWTTVAVGPRRDEHAQRAVGRARDHGRGERRVAAARDRELAALRRREPRLLGDEQMDHQARRGAAPCASPTRCRSRPSPRRRTPSRPRAAPLRANGVVDEPGARRRPRSPCRAARRGARGRRRSSRARDPGGTACRSSR